MKGKNDTVLRNPQSLIIGSVLQEWSKSTSEGSIIPRHEILKCALRRLTASTCVAIGSEVCCRTVVKHVLLVISDGNISVHGITEKKLK